MKEEQSRRKRRPRYKGKHPRRFEEKYKELNAEQYPEDAEKIVQSGKTLAGTHRPIMVEEVLEVLSPRPGETGLDATLGFGGHASELLRRIQPGGRLFGIDADPIEIVRTEERLRKMGYSESQLIIRRLNYAGIAKLLPQCPEGFDFILADLGVSSMQLDNPARGFTYKAEGPLDLRLNPERGKPAWMLLESLSREEFEKILRENSDEPHSAEIAKAVYQSQEPVRTTTELAAVIKKTLSGRNSGRPESEVKRSIRRTFQALRIEVNDEFFALEQFLSSLPFVLRPGGRAAVLSFHSGEDRRVARAFEDGLSQGFYRSVSPEARKPGVQECYDNPRAKSALLRWGVVNDEGKV